MNLNKNYYKILCVNPESYETVIILTTTNDLRKYKKI